MIRHFVGKGFFIRGINRVKIFNAASVKIQHARKEQKNKIVILCVHIQTGFLEIKEVIYKPFVINKFYTMLIRT